MLFPVYISIWDMEGYLHMTIQFYLCARLNAVAAQLKLIWMSYANNVEMIDSRNNYKRWISKFSISESIPNMFT